VIIDVLTARRAGMAGCLNTEPFQNTFRVDVLVGPKMAPLVKALSVYGTELIFHHLYLFFPLRVSIFSSYLSLVYLPQLHAQV
jgi:hypothetical protein